MKPASAGRFRICTLQRCPTDLEALIAFYNIFFAFVVCGLLHMPSAC
jgi:hypothetical protein